MTKRFFIDGAAIKPDLAAGHGACVASDMITVEGHVVGYMYRQEPRSPADSGWHFFTGLEPEDYCEAPENFAICDVNTIANYDPGIIPLLSAPVGAAFERDASGRLVAAPLPEAFGT